MKKYRARWNCKIVLILAIWDVVNNMQTLKMDEFYVDSFPLKNYQFEKQIVRQVISTLTKHILTLFIQLYLSINKNSASYLCTTYLQCCIRSCLLARTGDLCYMRYPKSEKAQVVFEKIFLDHCQLSKLFEISFLLSFFTCFF